MEREQKDDDHLAKTSQRPTTLNLTGDAASQKSTSTPFPVRAPGDITFSSAQFGALLEPDGLRGNQIPTIAGADTVYYMINVRSNLSEVDTLLDTIKNPRAFMYEFDPTVDVSTLTATRLHPAGVRSFTYTDAWAPTEAELQALYAGGYDVVSSQVAATGVAARQAINQSRGVSLP